MTDAEIVHQFENFLSWGQPPRPQFGQRKWQVPPAWFAYAAGLTPWCPPKGEM